MSRPAELARPKAILFDWDNTLDGRAPPWQGVIFFTAAAMTYGFFRTID